jgi:hypothetical protein
MRKGSLLFVPLDDRPCCRRFPVKVAEIVGLEIEMPPRDLLGRFLTPGNHPGIMDWLESHIDVASNLILSIDMCAYGGLVASRTLGKSWEEVSDRLERLRALLTAARTEAWAFNVIMRSSPTMTSPEEMRLADRLWKLSILYHEIKSGRVSADILRKAIASFPPDVLRNYFAIRGRNHRVGRLMVEWLDEGVLDFLLLGMDDSRTKGINVLEREALERLIDRSSSRDRAAVYPGADEMAMILLTRFILRKFNLTPSLHVTFTYPGSERLVPLYEDRSYAALVEAYARALGVTLTDDESGADILLFCHTPEKGQKEVLSGKLISGGAGVVRSVVERLGRKVAQDRYVAVADLAFANGADTAFVRELSARVPVPALLSYAAWNTAGNTLGTALSHGIIRWAALRAGRGGKKGTLAHYRFLYERFVEDWLYLSGVRARLTGELMLKGINPMSFPDRRVEVEHRARALLVPKAQDFFYSYFRGFKDSSGLVIGDLGPVTVCLPWSRLFEIELDAAISPGP